MTFPLGDPEVLGDLDARNAVRTRLDETLFVEAGAGTGKTEVLVERIVALVTADGADGPIAMRSVAAITFTEKAAAELRDRVRRRLEERAQVAGPDSDERALRRSRSTSSTPPRSARCTPSPSASSPRFPWRRVCRRASRCTTRCRRCSRSTPAGAARETTCSTIPRSSRPCSCCSVRAGSSSTSGASPSSSTTTGTFSIASATRRRCPPLELDAWFADLDARDAPSAMQCHADEDKLLDRLELLAEYRDRIRNAVDDAARIELLLSDKPSFRVGRTGSKVNWTDINAVRDQIVRLDGQRDGDL